MLLLLAFEGLTSSLPVSARRRRSREARLTVCRVRDSGPRLARPFSHSPSQCPTRDVFSVVCLLFPLSTGLSADFGQGWGSALSRLPSPWHGACPVGRAQGLDVERMRRGRHRPLSVV